MTKTDIELVDRARHITWEGILDERLQERAESPEAKSMIGDILRREYHRCED